MAADGEYIASHVAIIRDLIAVYSLRGRVRKVLKSGTLTEIQSRISLTVVGLD